MGRRIVTMKTQAAAVGGGGQPDLDSYFERVRKYIPEVIVGAWLAAKGIVVSATGAPTQTALWGCVAFGVVFSGLYIYRELSKDGMPVDRKHVVISMVAFIVWVWALGEPFTSVIPHGAMWGSLVLIGFCIVTGFIFP